MQHIINTYIIIKLKSYIQKLDFYVETRKEKQLFLQKIKQINQNKIINHG